MRLSALNIFSSYKDRRAQQVQEVKANSKPPKKVWDKEAHNGWGDSIQWMNWEKRRLVGWTTPLPVKGDMLQSKMESGKVAQFEFVKVEPCIDPSDMWFATVKDIGYADEQ